MSPHATSLRRRPTIALPAALVVLALFASPVAGAGKPGYPDRVTWSGATWSIKSSRSAVGPGPNLFSLANVSVDSAGLHLKVAKDGTGKWSCAEVIGPASLGYGTYTFKLASRVDNLDPNVVLGLFTWSDRAPYAHREIDIEFARWGSAADPTNAQYVVQPAATANHLARFKQTATTTSTQTFVWKAGGITWQSLDESGAEIASYAYSGTDVPRPGDERVRLNLWLFGGSAPINGAAAEVVVSSFTFSP
jgi:hypothetical protein